MKRLAMIFLLFFCVCSVSAQLLSWDPGFAKDNDPIEITLDASKGNQGLFNYTPESDVYVHVGVITNLSASPSDWKYVKFTWGTTNPAAQAVSLGSNKWKYSITNIRTFFAVPGGETILKIAILFRNGAGSQAQRNADGSDMYIPVYGNTLAVRFSIPFFQPKYVPVPEPINKQVGDQINVTGIASQAADMKLYLNGSVIQTASGVTNISANPSLSTPGNTEIVVEGTAGAITKKDTLRFFVSPAVNVAPLPAGVKDGINYAANNTEITLVLCAPNKNRVSVIGEFPGSNWAEQTNYMMNKTPDGNYWWLHITGLTPGTEYAFQYLVDGILKVAEPYAEKILDPFHDPNISSATYPGLRAYPTGQTTGIVSIVQTNAPAYTWAVNNFSRPDKRNLVIYELLLRDFLATHDWKTLRDSIRYFKNLGVNAIEIMPFNEFDGNESWGYNPSYFLAPDKYYGPKNSLKEFIDTCHQNGIAVIMDIALNHTTGNNPLAALYWNSNTNQPAANNPWLNVTATHPYSVFNDFNHESLRTRYFTSRVIEHWLQEYKLDGFRWDLSKGFTQTVSGADVNLWGQYDASRIAIWKRYYDSMQLKSPGSFCILEHFADNNEEKELSDYGMLLWGNVTYNFQEAAMGFTANSNFEGVLHTSRNWNKPHLAGYMESHDEERIMYKNLLYGNHTNAAHNIREIPTALKRVELDAAFFYTTPGPKMLWQFGELGYDQSINRCTDGSINPGCRLDKKPILWNYLQDVQRKRVFDVFSALNKLRAHVWYKDVFIANNLSGDRDLAAAFKWMRWRSFADTSCILVIGNFDVLSRSGTVTFPVGGTWYDYLNGGTITATGSAQSFTLQAGEYHIYLNRNLVNAVITSTGGTSTGNGIASIRILPQPVTSGSMAEIQLLRPGWVQLNIFDATGRQVRQLFTGTLPSGTSRINMAGSMKLPAGIYWLQARTGQLVLAQKFVIQ